MTNYTHKSALKFTKSDPAFSRKIIITILHTYFLIRNFVYFIILKTKPRPYKIVVVFIIYFNLQLFL